MSEHKVPGVVDAELTPISEKTYATLLVVALVLFALAILVVVSLPS